MDLSTMARTPVAAFAPESAAESARRNRLLARLPPAQRESLRDSLELVRLRQDDVLYESDRPLRHIHFPVTAIVSLVCRLSNGASTEIAVAGNEGMIGVQAFLGGTTMPHQAVVRSPGLACRIDRDLFLQEFERAGGRRRGALQEVSLRYSQALLTQLAQMAVCNRHHSVHQRLCRWLLMDLDRAGGCELTATQESIASLLGVRREGVTAAARYLQSIGLIRYRRGRITLTDRPGLESEACECYRVITGEYERLFTMPSRRPPSPDTLRPAEARFAVAACGRRP